MRVDHMTALVHALAQAVAIAATETYCSDDPRCAPDTDIATPRRGAPMGHE